MTDIRPVAFPGTEQQFYPQTHVNAVIGLTGQFLYTQIKPLLDWNDIANKPKLVTQNDLTTAIDGIQVPTITWASIADKPDVATKADVATAVGAVKVPDVSGLAKQSDLALTQKYGLPSNYWINKTQTVGKSLDSNGLPTVINAKAITSDLIAYDSAAQLVCVGWGAEPNDQLTVAFFDSNKKFLSSTIWTITAKGTGDRPRSIIEFYKYAVASTAYIRISCGYSNSPQCMVVSAVFEQHDFVPALADLEDNQYPLVTDLSSKITPFNANWSVGSPVVEEVRLSANSGYLKVNATILSASEQAANIQWDAVNITGIVGTPKLPVDTRVGIGVSQVNAGVGNVVMSGLVNGGVTLGATYMFSVSSNFPRAFDARIPLKY
ncbi:hypothetical protein [Furfurilactobacillus entadae]|uniref:hypothetical protein n=1 Tax=Furfurilactobacillus entadae TaxID=2922307 RepID=UPI0035EBEDE1